MCLIGVQNYNDDKGVIMDKKKALLMLDELITFYLSEHDVDDESNFVIANVDDFELFIEKVLDGVCGLMECTNRLAYIS